jgi:hypothetical protein
MMISVFRQFSTFFVSESYERKKKRNKNTSTDLMETAAVHL